MHGVWAKCLNIGKKVKGTRFVCMFLLVSHVLIFYLCASSFGKENQIGMVTHVN